MFYSVVDLSEALRACALNNYHEHVRALVHLRQGVLAIRPLPSPELCSLGTSGFECPQKSIHLGGNSFPATRDTWSMLASHVFGLWHDGILNAVSAG